MEIAGNTTLLVMAAIALFVAVVCLKKGVRGINQQAAVFNAMRVIDPALALRGRRLQSGIGEVKRVVAKYTQRKDPYHNIKRSSPSG